MSPTKSPNQTGTPPVPLHKGNRNNAVCLSTVLFSIHPTAKIYKLPTSHVKWKGKNELGKHTVVCYCPRLVKQNEMMSYDQGGCKSPFVSYFLRWLGGAFFRCNYIYCLRCLIQYQFWQLASTVVSISDMKMYSVFLLSNGNFSATLPFTYKWGYFKLLGWPIRPWTRTSFWMHVSVPEIRYSVRTW